MRFSFQKCLFLKKFQSLLLYNEKPDLCRKMVPRFRRKRTGASLEMKTASDEEKLRDVDTSEDKRA